MSSFSPIPLTPSMNKNIMVSAINDAFRQIQAENRTKVIKDETGANRIIMGRFPDGTYGFAISQEGVDVLEAVQDES